MFDFHIQNIEHVVDGCQCKGKQCSQCKDAKCVYAFSSEGKRQGRRRSRCKVCSKAYAYQYRKSEQGKERLIAAYQKRDYSQTAPTHGQKRCFRCGIAKDYSEFHKDKSRLDGRCPECIECKGKRLKIYQQKYKPHQRAPRTALRRALTLTRKLDTSSAMTSIQDIEAWYDEAFTAQNGCCAICGKPETSQVGEIVKRLAIDHCHITGKLRGLLCFNCNAALGKFDDNPELLRRAIVYLQQ